MGGGQDSVFLLLVLEEYHPQRDVSNHHQSNNTCEAQLPYRADTILMEVAVHINKRCTTHHFVFLRLSHVQLFVADDLAGESHSVMVSWDPFHTVLQYFWSVQP